MRFFLELSYDGTEYAGWQRQPNVRTVQGVLEQTLKTIFQRDISLVGCGRTDKGVHARHYVAHCDLQLEEKEASQLVYKLNNMLPRDIACHHLSPSPDSAHARFDAISRTYAYDIHMTKNPFRRRYSTYISYGKLLDVSLLHEVSSIIGDTKDFTSFCKLHSDITSMTCIISKSQWNIDAQSQTMRYEISANRFLRGMVRLIVGSSLSVATGKLTLVELQKHIVQQSRSPLMQSAPPEGLALTHIQYQ